MSEEEVAANKVTVQVDQGTAAHQHTAQNHSITDQAKEETKVHLNTELQPDCCLIYCGLHLSYNIKHEFSLLSVLMYTITTTTNVLQPLYKSTCISR